MNRPIGVTIIAILVIIGGILGILGGLAGFGLFGSTAADAVAGSETLASVYAGTILVVSIVQLAVGIGLWMLKSWAWTLAVVVVILRVVGDVFSLFFGVAINTLITLAIHLVIMWYLFRPEVKQAFGR